MNYQYYNDNDDYIPEYIQLIREDSNGIPSPLKPEDPFNKQFEEPEYDWEKEGERLHALNILQMTEYQQRQRKLMAFLERKISALPGFKIEVNVKRTWCKVFIHRISEPKYVWVPKDLNVKPEHVQLVYTAIPGQCGTDEFEISFKDMHTLCVDISHITYYNGTDLFDRTIDDYPTITVLNPEKIIPALLEFQYEGNF